MEIVKFTLSGQGASFTRPHFNSVISSYSHIHKVALLGLLGAIIGIDKNNNVPEKEPLFYEKLKNLKVSIVPYKEKFFSKNDTIVESTGFFNKDGSNYIPTYENLINPCWDIYIMKNENEYYEDIKDKLLNKEAVFFPYLGRNHWFANIDNVKVYEGDITEDFDKIDSLFISENIETEKEIICFGKRVYFKEYMPIGFNETLKQYKEMPFLFTNDRVVNNNEKLISCDNRVLYFF